MPGFGLPRFVRLAVGPCIRNELTLLARGSGSCSCHHSLSLPACGASASGDRVRSSGGATNWLDARWRASRRLSYILQLSAHVKGADGAVAYRTSTLPSFGAEGSSGAGDSCGASSSEVVAYWKQLLLSPGWANGATDVEQLRALLHEALRVFSHRGMGNVLPEEVSAVFMQVYRKLLAAEDKVFFLRLLANEFGVQRMKRGPYHPDASKPPAAAEVDVALGTWHSVVSRSAESNPDGGQAAAETVAVARAAAHVRRATEPLYLQLLLPVSQQPGGIAFLVELRADLVQALAAAPAYGAALRSLSEDLRVLLAQWFMPGLLQLQRVSWEGSSGALLERVAASDVVHAVHSVEQLKERLGPARRVYCFLHACLPGEPLVVLHTAIMDHVPAAMPEIPGKEAPSAAPSSQQLATEEQLAYGTPLPAPMPLPQPVHAPSSSNTDGQPEGSVAVFYSIAATQPGLAGVDLGHTLIKCVVARLAAELPAVREWVTLSPVPGFRAWLLSRLRAATAAAGRAAVGAGSGLWLGAMHPAQLLAELEAEGEAWRQRASELQPLMLRLAAHYLLHERRRSRALDPVAHFHLRNGAEIWRINWGADLSPAGLQRSFGIMVNYRYDLSRTYINNRAYIMEGILAASPEVVRLGAAGTGAGPCTSTTHELAGTAPSPASGPFLGEHGAS